MYWDDKYGTHSVSPEVYLMTYSKHLIDTRILEKTVMFVLQVIASMRKVMTDESNSLNNSFLLDDDSR